MSRTRSARALAIEALIGVDGGGRANAIVPGLLNSSGLAERDRAFVTELVYGTVRMQRACDWLVDPHVRRRLDPEVRAALRLGAYQLVWLGTPAHAAVSATVDAVAGPGRGLVNAVLRRVAAQAEAAGAVRPAGRDWPAWPDAATRLSYPDWIVEQLSCDLGADAGLAALAAMNEPASATVRADGYIQDLGSQWVAAAVGAGAGERIADLCAAPGGKATWMAYGPDGPQPALVAGDDRAAEAATVDRPAVPAAGKGPPELVGAGKGRPKLVAAVDVDAGRAAMMAGNAAKLGLDNVAVVVGDGGRPPLPAGRFDRVLVDAPCSGLGVLRRRPDARWRIQPDDLPRLAALQRRLVEAAIPLLVPGGLLVYSVCTFTRVETAGIDRWLATTHPELRPVMPPGPPWEPAGRGARLLPQAAGTDGMFVLAVRSEGSPAAGR